MSTTFNAYAPPGTPETISCRSGNSYSADAFGYIKNISSADVLDVTQAGCVILGQPQNPLNFRNIIDGGDFTNNPWQRGTTFTGITSTATYTADRWFAGGGASSSISVSQQALTLGTLSGFTMALQFGRASANANTATINLGQVMETLDCIRLQNQPVTLSFYALAGANFSGTAVNVGVSASTTAGNDTSANLLIAGGNWPATPQVINSTFVPTTTWTRYTFTGNVPATATQLGVLLGYAPVGTAGANDWVQFAGVQLEQGEIVSPFEHRDVAAELEFCQRYCYVIGGTTGAVGSGAASSATAAGFYIPFPVTMRTAPSAITSKTIADLSVYSYANASVGALSAAAFGSASVNGIHVTTTSSGMTTAVPYVLYVATALAGNVVISADL